MKIVMRAEAIKLGLSHYFTGKPCKNGHISERNTYGRGCMKCNKDKVEAYNKKNAEIISKKRKLRYKNNIDHFRAIGRMRYEINGRTRYELRYAEATIAIATLKQLGLKFDRREMRWK